MPFDPEAEVRKQREWLLSIAERGPDWREYARRIAEKQAAQSHGLWKPLLEVAHELRAQQVREGSRA